MKNERRRVLGQLGLISGLALLPGRGLWAATPLLAPELRQIVARGELRVAMPCFDSPPFFYQEQGSLKGLDVDIATGLARVLQVPVRFVRQASSFNGVVEQVARREVDLAACKMSRTLARARQVRFSEPYFISRHALLLNRVVFARQARGRELAQVVRQFDGSLGVIRDSAFADLAAQNFPRARLVHYDSWEAVLTALERGEVVAAYRDELEMRRLFQRDPSLSLDLRLVALTDTEDAQALVLPPDAEQFLALVNLYLLQQRLRFSIEQVLHYGELGS
ncbi:ABC transporter substrate-binding protein [Azovibrio restrictus]|uniref:substrate-binding periplasmic protein n=1 Tax=Azovibrio restrictus TaxID=146938 RepID=UPI0026E93476|nr:ABC transporter substrate-binding protein [Azovibrio restrictus]MDD3483100.1 ABC transporter substrate-binding protein [Azovibrio restrictus]